MSEKTCLVWSFFICCRYFSIDLPIHNMIELSYSPCSPVYREVFSSHRSAQIFVKLILSCYYYDQVNIFQNWPLCSTMITFLFLYNFSFFLVNKCFIFSFAWISVSISYLCPNSAKCKFPSIYLNIAILNFSWKLGNLLFYCGLIILWVCCIAIVKVLFSFTITVEIPFITLLFWIPCFLVPLFFLLVNLFFCMF